MLPNGINGAFMHGCNSFPIINQKNTLSVRGTEVILTRIRRSGSKVLTHAGAVLFNFVASNGRLESFQNIHDIVHQAITRENGSVVL